MNKEQSLAAHRIKKSVATAKRNESIAKKNTAVAEAKLSKMREAFDAAKEVVDAHKKTLELAKQQILEQRELIKKYESLLNLKYQQIEEAKKSVKRNAEAANKNAAIAKAFAVKAEGLKVAEARIAKQVEVLKKAKTSILSLREAKEDLEKELEEAKKAVPANAEVTPEVAPIEKQAAPQAENPEGTKVEPAKPVDLDKFDEAKANKIADIYNTKYGIDKVESMKIFSKYGMREAVERIQHLANAKSIKPVAKVEAKPTKRPLRKPVNLRAESVNRRVVKPTEPKKIDEAKARKIAKIYNDKYKMDETASLNILKTYDQETALNKLQSIANVTKKYMTEANAPKVNAKPAVKADEAKTEQGVGLYSLFM